MQASELGQVADKEDILQLDQIEHSQSAELPVQSPAPTSELVNYGLAHHPLPKYLLYQLLVVF